MRLIRSAIMRYHATSTPICNASSQHADTASRVDVEPELDIAQYHMIELHINLMNFSAVTIFFGQDSIFTHIHTRIHTHTLSLSSTDSFSLSSSLSLSLSLSLSFFFSLVKV